MVWHQAAQHCRFCSTRHKLFRLHAQGCDFRLCAMSAMGGMVCFTLMLWSHPNFGCLLSQLPLQKSAMRLTSAGLLVGTGKVKRESLPESKLTDMVVTCLSILSSLEAQAETFDGIYPRFLSAEEKSQATSKCFMKTFKTLTAWLAFTWF